eukprot:Gregarina_sp_Poly_1__1345@NODE_1332_length_4355_cov_250_381530_g896_i0_p1_GENE_NODE_1332_length_4355_cov_250_381530_g896_i0NODE_1332_length_4355_cov_250_381530_g896_i0_p1_ORF_typecomplete_len771_score71_09CC/PF04942_14/3_2CC/PF04942_14/2_9e03CC/PF04942_14/9_2e03CC/PF04942_14/82CC/PF04942_14/6_9e02CC/PF04942_14/1_1e02CC/PF04942_14/2e02CC/PF04942_14/2_3e02TIL/PF01826_17/27TIL/PF01826_17/3_4e02TIL/PF01826_17/2_4e02TIL/PF01826_17/2_7e02TIL/PF01826_17/4_6e03TIL/PF01826_17/1_1e04FXa_inhibition/PF14670
MLVKKRTMSRPALCFLFVATDGARTQAHLPLQHGLPPVPAHPASAAYAGNPFVNYAAPVSLGGSHEDAVNAALHDIDSVPFPFNEWNVNHISGPSIFDCPQGFSLTDENTCIFLEYRAAEESCPYGSYRERSNRGCIQIDSVPPDRTCPAGFEYFMRGCIRRTQIPPMLTCPAGYSQVDSLCYSVSSIPPIARCPPGSILQENGLVSGSSMGSKKVVTCHTERFFKPFYQCPANSRLISQSLTPSSNQHMTDFINPAVKADSGDLWTVSTNKPQCLANNAQAPITSCPAGFVLATGTEVAIAQLEGLDYLLKGSLPATLVDHPSVSDLQCVKVAEYRGHLTCPPGYSLVWPAKRDLELARLDPFRGARCISTLEFSGKNLRGAPPLTPTYSLIRAADHSETASTPEISNTTIIKFFSERPELFDEDAVYGSKSKSLTGTRSLDERRRGRRNTRDVPIRYLLDQLAGTPQQSNEQPSLWSRFLENVTTGLYPNISFDRQSCLAQDLGSLKWVETTDAPPQFQPSALLNELGVLFDQLKSATEALWHSATLPNMVMSVPLCRELQTVEAHLSCPPQTMFKCLVRHLNETEFDGTGTTLDESVGAETRFLWKSRFGDPTPARTLALQSSRMDIEHASIKSCVEDLQGEASCQPPDLLAPATALCSEPEATLQYRPMQAVDTIVTLDVESRRLSATNSAYKVAVCVETIETEPQWECPLGIGTVGDQSGQCDVLLAQPLSASCPDGFTQGTQEKSSVLFGPPQKGGKKLGTERS